MVKACTSLEQSENLRKILPPESADFFHAPDAGVVVTEPYKLKEDDETVITAYKGAVPCWSLTALLSVLPAGTRLLKSATGVTYHCDCPKGNIDKWFDNPVDACYELILKLHKRDLL